MRKIIQNVITVLFIPVMLAGIVWSAVRQAWEMGADASDLLANWFER